MEKKDYVVFDKQALSGLRHNITHLQGCLQYMPKSVRTLKWDCDIFKKEMSIEGSVKYIEEKLNSILGVIDLAMKVED